MGSGLESRLRLAMVNMVNGLARWVKSSDGWDWGWFVNPNVCRDTVQSPFAAVSHVTLVHGDGKAE